jgi:hypothetical protein
MLKNTKIFHISQPLIYLFLLIIFISVNTQEHIGTTIDSNKKETNIEQGQLKCGTKETDYTPCLSRERADSIFSQCCNQYVPQGCYSLCQYESDELTARNLV